MRRLGVIALVFAACLSADAADEVKALDPDPATLALVTFDKLPLEDAGPLKLAVKQKDVTLAEGRLGKALDCRGKGIAYVPIPAAKAPTKAFTIEAWLFIDEFGKDKTLPWPVGRNALHGVYVHKGRKGLQLRYYLRLKPKKWTGLSYAVPTKAWFHTAVTFDGKTMKAYVNGKVVASREAPGELVNSGSPLFFGTSDASGRNRFMGLVDEVRYSNVARTEFTTAR